MREVRGYWEMAQAGHPEAIFDELHDGPIYDPDLGRDGVVITGDYDAIREIQANPDGRFSHALNFTPLYELDPALFPLLGPVFAEPGAYSQDGDEHEERKGRAAWAFGRSDPADPMTLQGLVHAAMEGLVDRYHTNGGVVDLATDYVGPLAEGALTHSTGIPYELAEGLGQDMVIQNETIWSMLTQEEQHLYAPYVLRVWDACQAAIAYHQENWNPGTPPTDLITGYVHARGGEGLTGKDRADVYGTASAAYVASRMTMANILFELIRSGRWNELHNDPAKVPEFVKAARRFHTGVHGWYGAVGPDSGVLVEGEYLDPETRLIQMIGAANIDPRHLRRDELTFGHDAHACLGRVAASRLEVHSVGTLVENFSDAYFTVDADTLQRRANLAFRGHMLLPVELIPV